MRVSAWFVLPFMYSSLVLAEPDIIKDASFTELLTSKTVLQNNSAIETLSERLWKKYQERASLDTERKNQHNARALKFGSKTMKFTLEKIGNPSASGYPVYIALHGGGGTATSVNDSQWRHMQIYYKGSVGSGIYIAPRGVTDTWNLHFVDESYPLYDRMIENLIAYEGADPNRIYLLGFSAGGDGVYQVVPRMPDRWAAANMSAGHHNWINFDNLLNTPFLIQVGEYDRMYNRNHVAAENWLRLKDLGKQHSGYQTDVFIHSNRGHNGWADNDPDRNEHPVLKNPKEWLKNGDTSTLTVDSNAVRWLDRWKRASQPTKLIWDLSTQAPRPQTWGAKYVDDASVLRTNRDLFYWLAVDTTNLKTGRLEVQQFPETNAVKILKVEGVKDFKILVRNDVFDFSKPISIFLGDEKLIGINPEVHLSVMTQTLLERGDRNFLYHMEIPIHVLANFNEDTQETDQSAERFSYCSEGRCTIMSADAFWKVRQFPKDINYKCKKDSQYALTFDDGPSANTDRLLALLDRYNVKATFFVTGNSLSTPEGKIRLQHMAAKGHQISNHTMTHRSLTELNDAEILQEVKGVQDLILQTVGNSSKVLRDSSVVRPPFGNMSQRVQDAFKSIGFSSVRWNGDRYDWKLKAGDKQILRKRFDQQFDFVDSISSIINRSILDLNHEGSDLTLSVLDEMIPKIKAKGYDFVSVSECIDLI